MHKHSAQRAFYTMHPDSFSQRRKAVLVVLTGFCLLSSLTCGSGSNASVTPEPYVSSNGLFTVSTQNTVLSDSSRTWNEYSGTYQSYTANAVTPRLIPVKVYAPDLSQPGPFPLIMVSHGLGGDFNGTSYLAEYLAARGYIVAAVQHHGSDSDYLAAHGSTGLLYYANTTESRIMRPEDMTFVLNAIAANTTGLTLADISRIDLDHIGIFGHSFGAFTTLACLGATFDGTSAPDSRFDCGLAMSPQGPGTLGSTAESWNSLTKPTFTMGGTNDTSPGTDDPADRRIAFDSMPATGSKYHATLKDAVHADFGNDSTFYHDWICQMSGAFFDANLKGDTAAAGWLKGKKIQTVTSYVVQENK